MSVLRVATVLASRLPTTHTRAHAHTLTPTPHVFLSAFCLLALGGILTGGCVMSGDQPDKAKRRAPTWTQSRLTN